MADGKASVDVTRDDVVAGCLALAATSRVSVRPWRIEEALTAATHRPSTAATVITDWAKLGGVGPSAPGLESIVTRLHRTGALVYSRDWRAFVVDPWWRSRHRERIQALDHDSLWSLTAAAQALDDLEREPVVGTSANTAHRDKATLRLRRDIA